MIGGGITYYYKKRLRNKIRLQAPNSKKLSLRSFEDIKQYVQDANPKFIINSAITAIDSDPQLALEINYLGSINLAKIAAARRIPYIHFSSGATLPAGENIEETDQLPLKANLSNYAKSKLMADQTLRRLAKTEGLDYTTIRLAIVYGRHDHKIQGITHLFFAVANQTMPFMMTKPKVKHSYSNARKVPFFVDHVIRNRSEYSGKVYHLVDPEPVVLSDLILAVKKFLKVPKPRKIYIPYSSALVARGMMSRLLGLLRTVGVASRMPAEMMFLERFYQTQTLSSENLRKSSFLDPYPDSTIFKELPDILRYYIDRWHHLNLLSAKRSVKTDSDTLSRLFVSQPEKLMEEIHRQGMNSAIDDDFLR